MSGSVPPPHFRNIFHFDDNDEDWKRVLEQFDNKVPRFEDKASCVEFLKEHCQRGSNPDEPGLMHSVSTLTDWDQIEKHLLPKIIEYNKKWPVKRFDTDDYYANNRYCDKSNPAGAYATSRLDLSVHRRMDYQATMNTLRYLFFHMRCGIYVMVRNNEVAIFAPFVNKHYRNNWGAAFKLRTVGDGDKSGGNTSSGGQAPRTPEEYRRAISEYYRAKEAYIDHARDNYLPDAAEWWANGNIICNQHTGIKEEEAGAVTQWWGDSFLLQLKDMVAETCRLRRVPDCEFFINKRDYPNLKFHTLGKETTGTSSSAAAGSAAAASATVDSGPATSSAATLGEEVPGLPVEPYGFIFDRDDRDPDDDVLLSRHRYGNYAPIMSFYSSARFADIPIPPTEDWESATGLVFPPSFKWSRNEKTKEIEVGAPRDFFTTANLRKFNTPWEEKEPTAFFRGTATGGGVTVETNQRLKLCSISHEWAKNPPEPLKPPSESDLPQPPYPYLDSKITGWNIRDKKVAGRSMAFLRQYDFPFKGGKFNFVPIYEQGRYKYVVYVEGHCAACRYGFMMLLGAVILKVESSCVADSMWYFPLLQPFVDHVPVKADMSDLQEKIEWCRANDAKCKEIAANAKALYEKYVSRDGVLDYMQHVMVQIAERWHILPESFDASRSVPSTLVDRSGPKPRQMDSSTGKPRQIAGDEVLARVCTMDDEVCTGCVEIKAAVKEQMQMEKIGGGVGGNRRKREFSDIELSSQPSSSAGTSSTQSGLVSAIPNNLGDKPPVQKDALKSKSDLRKWRLERAAQEKAKAQGLAP